ncbi:MAG: polyphosphate polymerase domain-containing protein [Clostridia bacterium]|nr:polyphosphate polymerase domain-containing protein [Clostridia bacterium]
MENLLYTFERVEKKYLLTKEQYRELNLKLKEYVKEDEYGKSTILTTYFDTENFNIARHCESKPEYKEKLRLRSYGVPTKDTTVFLEIKKKFNGITYKRRIGMTLKEAENYLFHNILPNKQDQIFKEINYFKEFYNPVPKVTLSYERNAYYGITDSNLRITFDSNIRQRQDDLSLSKGDKGTLLLDEGICLMEIKALGAMPIWLTTMLSELKIYPTSFSKYGKFFEEVVFNEGEEEKCLKVS